VSVGRTVGEISGKLDKFEGRPPGARFKVSREEEKLSFFQVLSSVISSFFGVQKNATRERDFKRGRARDFILVGLLLTVAFIFAVWGVVQLVMRLATP
jgi:hypothetical protein